MLENGETQILLIQLCYLSNVAGWRINNVLHWIHLQTSLCFPKRFIKTRRSKVKYSFCLLLKSFLFMSFTFICSSWISKLCCFWNWWNIRALVSSLDLFLWEGGSWSAIFGRPQSAGYLSSLRQTFDVGLWMCWKERKWSTLFHSLLSLWGPRDIGLWLPVSCGIVFGMFRLKVET